MQNIIIECKSWCSVAGRYVLRRQGTNEIENIKIDTAVTVLSAEIYYSLLSL